MDYNKIMLGIIFGIIGQIGTFLQLQGGYKYGWYNDYNHFEYKTKLQI